MGRCDLARMLQLRVQACGPVGLGWRDLERVREHRGRARARAEPLEPAALREQRGKKIGVDRKRRLDGFAFALGVGKMLAGSAQRHEHEQIARHELPCRGQQRVRSNTVAALERVDAKAEQRARMLRVAPTNLEPDPLRLVPVSGAREATRLLDELLDLRGHAVSVTDSRRRPQRKRRAEARRSCCRSAARTAC